MELTALRAAVFAISNTEGAVWPTFSPDGQWVSFQAGGMISGVPVVGGPAFPVAAGATGAY